MKAVALLKSLNELIEDGVIELTRGKIISKVDMLAFPGHYPVYSSAKEKEGKFGEYGYYMFDEELITWSVDGGGRLFYRPKHKFSVTNVGGILRILDKSFINYKYLYYALTLRHSEVVFDWVRKAHPSIIKKLYKNIPVPLLPNQQRIVTILDETFAAINAAIANAEKNFTNAGDIFNSYLQSLFIQRGEGWEQKRLVEISLEFGRGKSKHRPRNAPKLYGGRFPFIQTGDVSNADHRLKSYTQTYSEFGLAQSRLWKKETICIAIVGANVGETAILDFDACFPDSVIGMVVDEEVADNQYIEYLLCSCKALLKEKGKGTARDNINLGTFENQKFPIPSLNRQKEIVATLNALRQKTQRLESIYQQKIIALDELKKSILHQAFSGQLN